jgi:hypothetical protein
MLCFTIWLCVQVIAMDLSRVAPKRDTVKVALRNMIISDSAVVKSLSDYSSALQTPLYKIFHELMELSKENPLAVEKYLKSKEFKDLSRNKLDSVELYDMVYNRFRIFRNQPEFVAKLKEIAFNRDFPDKIDSIAHILSYGNSRQETLEFLSQSRAFKVFTSNRDNLEDLIVGMRKGHSERWGVLLPNLEKELLKIDSEFWLKRALAKKDIGQDERFIKFIQVSSNAEALFWQMKGKRVDPVLFKKVKFAAFDGIVNEIEKKNIGYLKAKIIFYRDSGILDVLSASTTYQEFIKDPLKAYYLSNRFAPQASLFENSGQEGMQFLKDLQNAGARPYKDAEDIMRSLESIEDYSIPQLDEFEPFQAYIADLGNVAALMKKMTNDPERLKEYYKYLPDVVESSGNYALFQKYALAMSAQTKSLPKSDN